MDRRLVAVVGVFIGIARGEVQTARNLFIKKNVVLRVHDEGVEPDGEFPNKPGPFIGVKDRAQVLGTFVRAVLHNLAIFEHQTDVGKVIALVTGGRVVLHDPVD